MSAPHHPKPGKRPSRWQLKQMVMDGVMSTTDGCRILDLHGHCEHGRPSWLSVLSPSPEAQETRAAGEERA